ncbi:MAG TPA: tetratricopeptide repeat protein, partial [Gemmataceae bacterium]|nr:tetratricopeptide repeat protein [Gemmataceae bacterium]
MATVGFLVQVSVLAGGAALVVVLWLLFGRAPRCRRLYGRAQRLLQAGQWQQALAEIAQQPALAASSPAWQQHFRKLEADCHAFAGEEALAQKDYEASLDHHLRAAQIFHLDAEPVRQRLREAMLSELHQRFANGSDVQTLGNRLLKLFPACTEALFWQALDDVRPGQIPAALDRLRSAAACAEPAVEPPLYLGALLLRQGEPSEALRYLTIAQRIAPNCPLTHWQLGAAQAAAGHSAQAVQLLQRAAGPGGLPRWLNQPMQLWIAGLADTGHSYIARMAAITPYRCPVFGHDVAGMLHEVRLELGQAHERLKQFAEAANIYAGLLRDYPPTMSVLRGLGVSLARLGRYDEAFTHLRTA